MIDERAFISRVEAANTEQFSQLLRSAGAEEERALRTHFGDRQYERLRELARRPSATRGLRAPKGNVVIAHGIMGGELTLFESGGSSPRIWMNIPRLVFGALEKLRLKPDGSSVFEVRATGILKKYYGELILSLSQDWNVRAFWYDWRKDLDSAAADLQAQIKSWFGDEAPVHIVAHSMGGLVARTFAKKFASRWQRGGRLLMLGTPNHGSFAIPQVITGAKPIVRQLALLDFKHDLSEVLAILNTFPGSLQMLPSPLVMPRMEALYQAATYGAQSVLQSQLDAARRHHDWLSKDAVDGERMSYVAGYNQPTFVDVADLSRLGSLDGYQQSLEGDGTVPHRLGFLQDKAGRRIPTFFVEAEHGNLPSDERVINAVAQLLATGDCDLPGEIPAIARRGLAAAELQVQRAARTDRAQLAADEARLLALSAKLQPHARGIQTGLDRTISPDEREAEAIVLRDFLRTDEADSAAQPPMTTSARPADAARSEAVEIIEPPTPEALAQQMSAERKAERIRVEIALVQGGIETIDGALRRGGPPVDALAVGHYIGVRPQAAEKALDEVISTHLRGKVVTPKSAAKSGRGKPAADAATKVEEPDLLLTQYTARGTIRGDLGQPFFLLDPRDPRRVITLAGMGVPGRFGVPELTVLAQELCWALGRMGKKHLASVLIGAGTGNLSIDDAISAWLRGIRRAVAGSVNDEKRHLLQVTFVENDPRNIEPIDDAIQAAIAAEKKQPDSALHFAYEPQTSAQLKAANAAGERRALAAFRRELKRRQDRHADDESVPVRLTITFERNNVYKFAAITASASIPEREVLVDPRLVEQANDELAAACGTPAERDCGRLIEQLLIPEDIRPLIYTNAPLVLMLDATTARVHWEIAAQSDARFSAPAATESGGGGDPGREFDRNAFFGTSRGLTRQLRTTFAPPPEPPPPPRRKLRVLVVADPAPDATLPGAQAEGEEVAALFESFNSRYGNLSPNEVEVVALFGPSQATRTSVLQQLMFQSYDVLHFAGHCVFDKEDPANSGWIFHAGKDERLTARELNRVDRIPKFIFSNACESGITPDRSGGTGQRSAALAPSFAEAFFARGVANFICTAWPVGDAAAKQFARRVYAGLLGLETFGKPEHIHVALREARVALATGRDPTWGAYQHYGNPYFRFFDPETLLRKVEAPAAPAASAARGKRRRSPPRRSGRKK